MALVHYIDGIVSIGSSEKELAATTLNLLVTPRCIGGWEINPTKNSSTFYLREMWRSSVVWVCRGVPSKVKEKCLRLVPPVIEREA